MLTKWLSDTLSEIISVLTREDSSLTCDDPKCYFLLQEAEHSQQVRDDETGDHSTEKEGMFSHFLFLFPLSLHHFTLLPVI